MCGIAGVFRPAKVCRGEIGDADTVAGMIGTLAHRGPDAEGIWQDARGRCVLGHRRLSIIDTSEAGRQPMISGDDRYIISFNGELYNYLELASALRESGVRLRGRTDTEVLLEAVAFWGEKAFSRCDGQFAMAIFDTATGELLLARDPFGEKPLYYTELATGAVAFASELQALERVSGFDPKVDVNAIAEMLAFQYIGAPRSIYRSVKKLGPGEWLKIDANGYTRGGRYFSYRPGLSGFDHRPIADLADELEDILLRSISRRLIADVPLGAFLSGGVDSSTVCALVRRRLGRPLTTFSIGFDGAPSSEHMVARAFAEHLGTTHHDEILTPDPSEFLQRAGQLLDEPNGDSSCLPTYLLSRLARRYVTVAVSGDGGDEMFGGYGRYFATLDDLARHRRGELPEWRPGAVYYGVRILVATEQHVEELLGFVPPAFAEHTRSLRAELDDAKGRLLCEMRRHDGEHYMPGAVLAKVDRMSMQHALEVRTPYLNVELARFAERLPDSVLVDGGRGKLVLREVAYRYLPRELIDLPKAGFGLPESDWARTAMLGAAERLLESPDGRLRAAFGAEGISRFMNRHRTQGQFSAYQVWGAAVLESWLQHHPAELPSFVGAARKRSLAEADNRVLRAHRVGDSLYLVSRTDLRANTRWLSPSTATEWLCRTADLECHWDLADRYRDEQPQPLPDWGVPLSPDDRERLKPLRGASLLFIDSEAIDRCDYEECEKLVSLGVARAIFPDVHNGNDLLEFRFKRHDRLRHALAIVRLFWRRLVWLSNKRGHRMLGATTFTTGEDGLNRSGLLRKLEPLPDKELCSDYAVFEGTRQLPPLPVPHAVIGARRAGRYSIWNQQLIFTPSEEVSQRSHPVWVVHNCAATQRLLPIAARRHGRHIVPLQRRSELIGKLLAAESSPFELASGDPVVVCTHGLPAGGAERQWIYLAQSLRDLGYRVSFVVYEPLGSQNSHYLPMLEALGIPLIDADSLSLAEQFELWPQSMSFDFMRLDIVPAAAHLLALTAAFRKLCPKVVFGQLDYGNLVAGFAALIAGVPRYVMSFRNYNPSHFPYLRNDWFLPAYRELTRFNRIMLAGNHKEGNHDYARWIGIAPERIAWIPNAIDAQTFPVPAQAEVDEVRAELQLQPDTPTILGVFRLSEEKDPLAFIEVCARVIDAVPGARAFIVGTGWMSAQIEQQIGAFGLSGRIRLLGQRTDVNALMRAASVLLLTSRHEGMPNVIMEAQMMGTPVVATGTGGVRDTVINGRSAVLLPVGDIDGLVRAVLDLLGDPTLAKRMGEAGCSHVLSAFPKRRLAEGYLSVARGEHLTAPAGERASLPSLAAAD